MTGTLEPPSSEAPPPLLRVDGVGVRVGARALLDDVSFAVRAGELVALVGANGAGKSTLAKVVAGLRRPTSGAVALAGTPLAACPPRARARWICYVPQGFDAPPPFTVEEFVRLGRYAHDGAEADFPAPAATRSAAGDERAIHARADADRDAVEDALALAGVDRLRAQSLPTLSGGERQMVALAAALAQDARILLLDEPAAFLDVRHQESILSLLARLHRERGTTIVMVTHDVNAALHASRRVLALRRGRLAYDGPSADFADAARLAAVYDTTFAFVTHPVTGRRTVAGVGADAARRLAP